MNNKTIPGNESSDWKRDPLMARVARVRDGDTWSIVVDGKTITEGLARSEVESHMKSALFRLRKKTQLSEGKELKTDLRVGDDVIIDGANTGSSRGKTGVIDSFSHGNKFVVVDMYDGGKRTFHLDQVKANEYANSEQEELDSTDYDEDDEDHEPKQKEFWVVVYDDVDNHTWVGHVVNKNGKWHEYAEAGEVDYRWGGTYMGYLEAHDVMAWIHKDYGRGYEVEGPFFDKEEALDRAKNHFGGIREGVEDLKVGDVVVYKYKDERKSKIRKIEGDNIYLLDGSAVQRKAIVSKKSLGEAVFTDVEEWKKAVKDKYPERASKLKFKGRVESGKNLISAEIPGEDRSYGVFDMDKEEGEVLGESLMAQLLTLGD